MRPHATVLEVPQRLSARPRVPLAAVAVALLAAGCAQQPPRTIVKEVRVEVPVQVPVVAPTDNAARIVLNANDRLRQLSPLELGQEVAPRDDASLPPGNAVQLALALMFSHNNGETFRAQTLLDQVLRDARPEANEWRPIAQFLADRVAEQRRMEGELEKSKQVRDDLQRRLDEANRKLEALKAIERSLGGPRSALDKP
ncbi:hypothetical protein CS062_09525 [Roseateles chitinivorans]|uniref:Uncharacterized protein n=1 Tax=Roseateles chitinivorans TaxID=2917965 RepID=A0A2G9CAD6_9BURK|nr:hypothetical protein [Roseateles chitinivorans]PIM53401.1 hypothetical protein CS062_09525 [Roseateles chitinivorans]